MKQLFWRLIWEVSELTGISLGKNAPYVFGKMLGIKRKDVEEV